MDCPSDCVTKPWSFLTMVCWPAWPSDLWRLGWLRGPGGQLLYFQWCWLVKMQVKAVYVLLILSKAEFPCFSWGTLPLSYLQHHLCLYLNACLKTYLNCSQGRSCWNVFLIWTILLYFFSSHWLQFLTTACSEICSTTCSSKGLEITLNIYVLEKTPTRRVIL